MRSRLLATAVAAASFSACSTGPTDGTSSATPPASSPGAVSGMDDAVVHIHGLGVDPADGALHVATHLGLFRLDPRTGEPSRVADRYQDTMAFTVVGPGQFYASGHPDLREDLPPHLGLIESTDAGETWRPLAEKGDADFHILEPSGDGLYAYDALTGTLLRTEDYATFEEVLVAPLVSVAVLAPAPSSTSGQGDGDVLATTGDGRLLLVDPATRRTAELDAPALLYLDATPTAQLVGIGPRGQVYASRDRGSRWEERGTIEGRPAAFTITDSGWFAATEDTVLRSDDRGATWTRILPAPGS